MDASEAGTQDLAELTPDPIFGTMVDQAQAVARAAGWEMYQTEDGCGGASRPLHELKSISSLIDPSAAQKMYLFTARDMIARNEGEQASMTWVPSLAASWRLHPAMSRIWPKRCGRTGEKTGGMSRSREIIRRLASAIPRHSIGSGRHSAGRGGRDAWTGF